MILLVAIVALASGIAVWWWVSRVANRDEAVLRDRIAMLERDLVAAKTRSAELQAASQAVANGDLARLIAKIMSEVGPSADDAHERAGVPPVIQQLRAFGEQLLDAYERDLASAAEWMGKVATVLAEAKDAARGIASGTELSSRLERYATDLEHAASSADETTRHLRMHVEESRGGTLETAELAARARTEAERGYRAVHEALDEIEATRALSAGLRERMAELVQRIASIDRVVLVMTSVAQKTKLLALNASITAAQSGEAGQGFGVVAQEIKAFARQTAESVEEIVHQIQALQREARLVSDQLAENSVAVDRGLRVALRAGDSLGEIRESTRSAQRKIQGVVRHMDEHVTALGAATQVAQSLLDVSKRVANVAGELRAVQQANVDLTQNLSSVHVVTEQLAPRAGTLPSAEARTHLVKQVEVLTSYVSELSERARTAEVSQKRAQRAEGALRQAADVAQRARDAIGAAAAANGPSR